MIDEEKYDGISEELPQNFPNHDEGGEAVVTIVKEDDHQEDIKRLRSKYLLLAEEDEYTDEEKFIELEEQILAEKEMTAQHMSSAKKCIEKIQETIKNGNGNGKHKEKDPAPIAETALS